MSTNNSPQTLFRFVSFRNPNLAENNKRNLRFIYRPDGIVGFFDAVNSNNGEIKLQALRNLANQFSPQAIKRVTVLEEGVFSELLKIGKNISLNKKLSAIELKSAKDYYSRDFNYEALNLLWDNLIYQYITQNNFYVKEATEKIPVVSDYLLKQEAFDKMNKEFEKKSEPAKDEVTTFNKAVKELNNAVKTYNANNNSLNQIRSDLINNWNSAVDTFFDNHMPTYN